MMSSYDDDDVVKLKMCLLTLVQSYIYLMFLMNKKVQKKIEIKESKNQRVKSWVRRFVITLNWTQKTNNIKNIQIKVFSVVNYDNQIGCIYRNSLLLFLVFEQKQ